MIQASHDAPHCRGAVVLTTVVAFSAIMGFAANLSAQGFGADQVSGHRLATKAIQAGEFGVAKTLPSDTLPTESREAWLAQIAATQLQTGDSLSAASTVRQINSPDQRQAAISQRGALMQGNGVGGGGAFADFQPLMQLIETTIAPDTWDTVGGNSTMVEYPQGVYVDPSGTVMESLVEDATDLASKDSLTNLNALLLAGPVRAPGDWRAPSKLRCLSLRRLRDAIAAKRMNGMPLGDELLHLAGLSEVKYIVFAKDDVLLAAPVGGIDSAGGWLVDRQSGRSTLRSDFLARCFAASLNHTPFGCTIDPTPAGMKASMQVVAGIQAGRIPIGKSADQMRNALGMQRVEVFGAAGDTAVGLLMVEADRHMKQLALGEQEMPEGVGTYLDAVDRMIDQGTPNGLLLRLWFTAKPQSVRCDHEMRVFELAGTPIRLSGENQRALADGGRGNVTVDPRSMMFVEGFNQNWTRIRDKYPIYGTLESLYRLAAVAHIVTEYGRDTVHQSLAKGLAIEDESSDWNIHAPRQVQSIAALHTVRKGNKRHHVLLASGGVSIDASATVSKSVETYPTLSGQATLDAQRPRTINRWWWDVAGNR